MINIGDILRAFGVIDKEQLDHAVQEQRQYPGRKLGATVVALGYASQEAVDRCLEKQEDIKARTATPRDAAKLADYATERVLERRGGRVADITGVYESPKK